MQTKVSKEDWVEMFKEIGLDNGTMTRWHQVFETRHPEGHEDFLKWLGLSTAEIAKIRSDSQ